MEIRQFRVVLRAHDFERTCKFYGEVLALPKIQQWDRQDGRSAIYQAGSGLLEIQGLPSTRDPSERDEDFDFQGPLHKLTLTLAVPSAEKAYEELILREKNIPGGLKEAPGGGLVFETHDPDGVKVSFVEG
ncbi:MAG: VOC family protein [Thermoanaerobaculia bacterium]